MPMMKLSNRMSVRGGSRTLCRVLASSTLFRIACQRVGRSPCKLQILILCFRTFFMSHVGKRFAGQEGPPSQCR